MKLLKNTYTQCVCLAGFVLLLIGGCAASSSTPVTAQSTGTTYECEAGDTSWECRAQGDEIETTVAPAVEATPAEAERSQSGKRSWWRIRARGNENPGIASRDNPQVATNEKRQSRTAAKEQTATAAKAETPKRERRGFFNIRVRGRDTEASTPQVAETAQTMPTPVVDLTPAPETSPTTTANQPTVSISTRPSERLNPKPKDTSSRHSISQRPSATSSKPSTTSRQPVVVMQVPRSNSSATATARRVASPAKPDVPLDGLGRDYDYAVQLAAFTNYGLSSDFLNSYPSLDLMRVKTHSKGKTFYIVIAGTFENKNLASAQSQMLTTTYGMAEPYIRTVKSIRNIQIN